MFASFAGSAPNPAIGPAAARLGLTLGPSGRAGRRPLARRQPGHSGPFGPFWAGKALC